MKMQKCLLYVGILISLSACSNSGVVTSPESMQNGDFLYPSYVAVAKIQNGNGVTNIAYVVNNDDTISTCKIADDGTFSGCNRQSIPTFNYIYKVVSADANKIAYVINNDSDNILSCTTDQDHGLKECYANNGNSTFNRPINITLNSSNTVAYIVNQQGIVNCAVGRDGILGACTLQQDSNLDITNPQSLSLHKFATETYAFIINGDTSNTVTICAIDDSTNQLTGCRRNNGNNTFDQPHLITFNPVNNYAYIANFNNDTVSICQFQAGDFSFCAASNGGGSFGSVQSIKVNQAGDFAYVVNGRDNTISQCNIAAGGGVFANCDPFYMEGFMALSYMEIAKLGTQDFAYLTSSQNNAIVSCKLNSKGNFEKCYMNY
jgi:DNA-binding beta-propeller fold protein YncE